jgi:hypothetical protein
VFSAFAFTQIDFATCQRTYETKRNELGGIIDELKHFAPKKTEVFEKLRIIHSWGDTNPAPAGGLPKAKKRIARTEIRSQTPWRTSRL